MRIKVTMTSGYSTEVENPLITTEHNAVNQPGLCIVRGPGDPYEGNAVCTVNEVDEMEVVR